MKLDKLTRRISSIEDLSEEEQKDVLESLYQIPCIPVSLRFIKDNYSAAIDIDFSKVKDKDLDRIHLLTMQQIKLIMMHDYESLRTLSLVLQSKAIYAKCYEAYVLDKDCMDMELDEFRARVEIEGVEAQTMQRLQEQQQQQEQEE